MSAGRKVLILERVLTESGIPSYAYAVVYEATFHQFGLETDQNGSYSMAIIERADGRVVTVPVYCIQFVNPAPIEKEVD